VVRGPSGCHAHAVVPGPLPPPSSSAPRGGLRGETRRSRLARLLATLPDDADRFARLAETEQDWPSLFDAASAHGVASVLAHHLDELGIPLPAATRMACRERAVVDRLAHARIVRVLDEALAALGRAGVPVCPLKGPLLGERLYPAPELRRSSDVDLLVLPSDRDRAMQALAELGYRSRGGQTLAYELEHQHEVLLARGSDPPIELHLHAHVGFGTRVPAAPLLRAATPLPRRGAPTCLRLRPEDECMYLLVHAAGHLFERLAWLYDVKLLVRATPELDVATMARRAREHGCERALVFGAQQLREELGVELLLPAVSPRGARETAARGLARWAQEGTLGREMHTLASLLFHASLADRTSAAVGYAAHHAARITARRADRWTRSGETEERSG